MASAFASLRHHRNFRLYVGGQLVSQSGMWMQDAALAWLVFQLHHSSLDVGLIVCARFAPASLLTLVAGVLADRLDNRLVLIWTNAASMAVAALLTAVTAAGRASLAVLLPLALLGGSVGVLAAPNRLSFLFQLVGRADLPNAIALNSSLFNTTRVVGPAVAGTVIAAAGADVCFAANAASYLAALAALLLLRPAELVPLERELQRPHGLAAIREGIGYVRGRPELRLILLMTGVVGMAGFNFRVSLPLLASGTLHGGPGVFGALYACLGLGALAGALVAAGAGPPTWQRLAAAVLGFGLALLAIAPLRSVALDGLLLFVTGACSSLWTTTSQSILQLSTPDRLRGRVSSLYWFVFAGLTPLGSILIGALAAYGGTGLVFAIAGTAGLAMGAYAVARLRIVASSAAATPDYATSSNL